MSTGFGKERHNEIHCEGEVASLHGGRHPSPDTFKIWQVVISDNVEENSKVMFHAYASCHYDWHSGLRLGLGHGGYQSSGTCRY